MSETSEIQDWAAIKGLAARGDHVGAFAALLKLARPSDDFTTQRRYAKFLAKLPKHGLELRPLRVALLATSTTDHFAEILILWLALSGFDVEIHQPPFGQVTQSVLDPSSQLYEFKPDVVWLFETWRDVALDTPNGADKAEVAAVIAQVVEIKSGLWRALQARSDALIIQNNADIPALDVFGHFEANTPWSGRARLRRYNLALTEAVIPGVLLFDLDHVSACWGKEGWIDARYWHHSKHAFAFDATGKTAFEFSRLIAAAKGLSRKCLVLDLDNTLWGGVIGDDGLEGIKLGNGAEGEAFVEFQEYIRRLKERGVILAVCSKNDEANAREPFLKHPAMRLGIDDIAVFRANWDNKADNICNIAATLNIGLDSLVFVDDNPAERALVRRFLPMVAVPELPSDPSGYVAALHAERLFETVGYSQEDGARNEYYRANAQRSELKDMFADLGEYQKSLEMAAEVGEINSFYLPRAAQLINKSNQFNLTGARRSEAELRAVLEEPLWQTRYFTLSDKFGDNGLISVVLLRRDGEDIHIDTWVMSCRVLGRGMEEFIANEMENAAREMGAARLIGGYIPSKKNGMVANLYARLGFAAMGENLWRLDVDPAKPRIVYISKK
jgi:FkbH-like protein